MTGIDPQPLSSAQRHRRIARGLAGALGLTAALVALYFLMPFELIDAVPVWLTLTIAFLVLLVVTAWQIRAITRAAHPRIRATQALAITAPLYLLVFAAMYFVMAAVDSDAFSTPEPTRLDTLYFTVTIFATVGFGDISPVSQAARVLVTVQMIVNLVVLGAGIQVFVAAARRGRGDAPRRATQDTNNERAP